MKKNKEKPIEPRYTKHSVLVSKMFNDKKDIIDVILDENTLYTLDEIRAEINKFMKGKVK